MVPCKNTLQSPAVIAVVELPSVALTVTARFLNAVVEIAFKEPELAVTTMSSPTCTHLLFVTGVASGPSNKEPYT